MKDAEIDLMLMPHANPMPYKTNKLTSQKDIELQMQNPITIAAAYSNYLRVPVVYVNPVGSYPEFSGGVGAKSFNENFKLLGGSLIMDAHGKVTERMDDSIGFLVSAISLDKPSIEPITPLVYQGKWLHKGNPIVRYIIMPNMAKKGIRSYNKNHSVYVTDAMRTACRNNQLFM
jgi:hypothetical protein